MLLILISYWVGIFLLAGGIAAANPEIEMPGMIVIGLGAIVQAIILLIRRL